MAQTQRHEHLALLGATLCFLVTAYIYLIRLFAMPEAAEAILAGGSHNSDDAGRVLFKQLTLMDAVPEERIPTTKNKRRILVVGDIHGMDDELAALLHEAGFDEQRDHLVAAGDMITKGPNSHGVIARLMRLNASAVRGNHEDRILAAHAKMVALDGYEDIPAEVLGKGASRDRAVARSLSKDQIHWLQRLPLILTAGPLPIYVVHAGLVPGIKPRRQDPWAVMNMRTLVYPTEELRRRSAGTDSEPPEEEQMHDEEDSDTDEDGEVAETTASGPDWANVIPVDDRAGKKWYLAWNRYQKRLKRKDRRTIIYGHDARTGFMEKRYTIGLDSSCVKGGALTGVIIQAAEDGGFTRQIVEVPCKQTKA